MVRSTSGQATVEFALVIFLFSLIMFSTLELGLVVYEKMALLAAVREVARVAAVDGGYSPRAQEIMEGLLEAAGIDARSVSFSVAPKEAIYGTTIVVEASYDHKIVSPIVSLLIGKTVRQSARTVTRSEFVPR